MKVTQALGANWSTLLEELLGLILARLDLMDHFRFCSVGKQWRSVATESSALNKPIGLVHIDDPQCFIRQGLTMSGTSWHWTRIVRGFEGLLVLDKGWKLILLNPAFGDVPILVPPLNCISGIECADVEKVILSAESRPSAGQFAIVLKDYWSVVFLHAGRLYCLDDVLSGPNMGHRFL